MRVRCLVGIYSGEVREYPSEVAKMMLSDGRACPVREGDGSEVAVLDAPPECAVRRRGRPKGSKNKVRLGGIADG